LALPRNSECLGMSTFFRGITETIPSLFRGIISERSPFPTLLKMEIQCKEDLFSTHLQFSLAMPYEGREGRIPVY
jgi:hypothetical protein